jgi:hypothetical protein
MGSGYTVEFQDDLKTRRRMYWYSDKAGQTDGSQDRYPNLCFMNHVRILHSRSLMRTERGLGYGLAIQVTSTEFTQIQG